MKITTKPIQTPSVKLSTVRVGQCVRLIGRAVDKVYMRVYVEPSKSASDTASEWVRLDDGVCFSTAQLLPCGTWTEANAEVVVHG